MTYVKPLRGGNSTRDNRHAYSCSGLDERHDIRHSVPAVAPGYRPPSSDPRGRWAKHIHAVRKARGWNQTRAFEEWHVGLGLAPKSRTAYLNLDMGKRQPKPHEEAYLVSQIGPPPDEEPAFEPAPSDMAALVAALERQTEAINQLVGQLDLLASQAIREGVADALREAAEARGVGGSLLAPPLEQPA